MIVQFTQFSVAPLPVAFIGRQSALKKCDVVLERPLWVERRRSGQWPQWIQAVVRVKRRRWPSIAQNGHLRT